MFYNRLKNKKSAFNLRKWEKDFKTNQIYKKNICIYPSIDFGKSEQRKMEKEKNINFKMYSNTAVNFYNNLFNKTKFKEVKLFKPQNKKDSERTHYEDRFEIENGKKEFELHFIIDQNRKITVENCKKDDFFFDIVDKLCQKETNIDKNEIQVDEFTVKGKENKGNYIDYSDTLEGNGLQGNEEIIIKYKCNND